jgi:hypothetical protein
VSTINSWSTVTAETLSCSTALFSPLYFFGPKAKKIGATRFERATSTTPRWRANPGCATPRPVKKKDFDRQARQSSFRNKTADCSDLSPAGNVCFLPFELGSERFGPIRREIPIDSPSICSEVNHFASYVSPKE